jgi:hypothetical protein
MENKYVTKAKIQYRDADNNWIYAKGTNAKNVSHSDLVFVGITKRSKKNFGVSGKLCRALYLSAQYTQEKED